MAAHRGRQRQQRESQSNAEVEGNSYSTLPATPSSFSVGKALSRESLRS